jgi:hypothetical protein
MKVLIGFVLGLLTVFLLGAATEGGRLEVWGAFDKVGIYRPTFSGITPEGECYLAVTNTKNGETEIFGIPRTALAKIGKKPLQVTQQGTAIVELSR